MKSLTAAVKVGIVVLVAVIAAYTTFKSVSERAAGDDGFRLGSRLRDASGLMGKSRVVIAGLTIGEITGMGLDGRTAKVTLRIRKGTRIYENAILFKKSSSLLGEFYLEIDPGSPESIDEKGETVKNRILVDGDEIPAVVEATSTDEILRSAATALPKFEETVEEIRLLSADVRGLINGPVANMAERLDKTIAQDAELVNSILRRADEIAADVRSITGNTDARIERILSNVDTSMQALNDLLASTKGEVNQTGSALREKLDRLDRSLADLETITGHTASVAEKVDSEQGTIGRLINDPKIADNLEGITDDARGFTRSLFGLKTIVGLREEFAFYRPGLGFDPGTMAGRETLSVEIHARPDKYYLFEAVFDRRAYPHRTLVPDGAGGLTRTTYLEDDAVLFTLQYAKRFDWLTLRAGIKSSAGGVGADMDFWDGRLRLSTDLFDFSHDRFPRLRLAAVFQLYKYIYILGGIDDALNAATTVAIDGGEITGGEPTVYAFGRDVFGGAMLKFSDEDLKALLFMGGSALGGLVSGN